MNEPQATRVKLAALLVALLGLAIFSCVFLYALIHISEVSFRDSGGRPLPPLTRLTLDLSFEILLLPVPWLVVAVRLIVRNDASAFRLIAFSSTLVLALLSIAIFVIVTLAIPWLPMSIGFSHR